VPGPTAGQVLLFARERLPPDRDEDDFFARVCAAFFAAVLRFAALRLRVACRPTRGPRAR
jgi:hypothetical protein